MKASTKKVIYKIVAHTSVYKDTFAVPSLLALLRSELENGGDKRNRHDLVLQFVGEAVSAISASPIYSDTLVREFYKSVLDQFVEAGPARAKLLEDLLFQSVHRPPEPERSKRAKQKDAKAGILSAALEEFSEKGYHQATIDSISERGGIAKGTVYRYFKTKEQLFNALKEDTICEFVELVKDEINRNEDILDVLESVIRIYLGFFEKNSAFFKVIVQEHKDFGREFSEKFINELIQAFPGLKRACWKASRDGRLKQMNYFTVFFGIVGFLNGVIQRWLHEGCRSSLMDEAQTVKEVLFYGFALPKTEAATADPLKVIR